MGCVAVAVGVPHKCPIAPVEVMFSLHDYFKARGIRDKVHLKYHYPINRIHTIENVAKWAKPRRISLPLTLIMLITSTSVLTSRHICVRESLQTVFLEKMGKHESPGNRAKRYESESESDSRIRLHL